MYVGYNLIANTHCRDIISCYRYTHTHTHTSRQHKTKYAWEEYVENILHSQHTVHIVTHTHTHTQTHTHTKTLTMYIHQSHTQAYSVLDMMSKTHQSQVYYSIHTLLHCVMVVTHDMDCYFASLAPLHAQRQAATSAEPHTLPHPCTPTEHCTLQITVHYTRMCIR